jgi:hypothetical protein
MKCSPASLPAFGYVAGVLDPAAIHELVPSVGIGCPRQSESPIKEFAKVVFKLA